MVQDLTGHEIDVVVVQGGAGKHGAVRMESGADDGGGAVVMQEARVGLEGREVGAIDVERLDFVAVCAPRVEVSHITNLQSYEGILTC